MTDQSEKRPTVAVAILAAGKGKRMLSDTPKHVHPVGGVPIVKRIVRAGQYINPDHIAMVVSPEMADMEERIDMRDAFQTVIQEEPTGTAHAVLTAIHALPPVDYIISLLGDNPLLTGEVVKDLFEKAQETDAKVTVLTCNVEDVADYGRIERDTSNNVRAIVEKGNDADRRRNVRTEINSGIMVLKRDWALGAIERLDADPNAKETFLTDLVSMAAGEFVDGDEYWPVQSVVAGINVSIGINNRADQAVADTIARKQIRDHLMEFSGVTMIGADTIFIDETVKIGRETVILPGCVIRGNTVIGSGCEIGPNAIITNSTIGDNVIIRSSTIEDSSMEDLSDAGPYAHIRGGSVIGTGVHIGNFAELKKTTMHPGSKSGHVSYLGDAEVGKRTNIGAGTITANYDGKNKNPTTIGDDVFIGCDTVLIAPVSVGEGSVTGAGSIVNKNVESGVTVVGVPARPIKRESAEEKE